MSFPRYERYKASGVPWLGEIPSGWEVKRLKHVANVFPSNVDKKSYDGEPAVRLCNYTDVYYNEAITESLEFMAATASPEQIEKFSLRAGDTIITKDSETADDIAIAAHVPRTLPGVVCGYHLAMVRPKRDNSGAFFKRFFDSRYAKSCFAVSANGLTRVGLGQYELNNVAIALPSVAEQVAIAAFLDRETAKIDALVEEQRRLMELLKEKRQAVISHAVTRGLNSAAPLKPSGIEWLGDVPAHWEVSRVKSVSSFITSGPRGWSDRIGDAGAIFVQSGDLDDALRVDFNAAKRVVVNDDAETARTRLRAGDVVVCITGAKTGKVAVCCSVPEEAYVNQHLCLIRPTSAILPLFLGVVLKSSGGQTYFELSQYGLKQGLSLEDVKEAPIILPPLAEQMAIIAHLDAETQKFDALTAEAEGAIDLLQERRAALISAAVTGQIDVRSLAAVDEPIVLPCARRDSAPPIRESLPGAREMLLFWATGDVANLPESPAIAVMLNWLNGLEAAIAPRREFGLADDIARLGWTHQQAMDLVLDPATEGRFDGAEAAHPLVLMHCLWRIGVHYGRDYAPDLSRPISSETVYGVGRLWAFLRAKLIAGDYRPPLVFSR